MRLGGSELVETGSVTPRWGMYFNTMDQLRACSTYLLTGTERHMYLDPEEIFYTATVTVLVATSACWGMHAYLNSNMIC